MSVEISVVIPVYNAEKYIDRCLESILRQEDIVLEVICVDDGSTDNSLSLLKEYEKRYENVCVLTQENQFAGIARNKGLTVAKGKYIHFMDIDDYVVDGAYKEIYDMACKFDADYIKAKSYAIDSQTQEFLEQNAYTLEEFSDTHFEKIFSLEEDDILLECTPAPWSGLVKREYILSNQIRFNGLRCANDRSFYIATITKSKKLFICNNYMVCHMINNSASLVGVRANYFECQFQSYDIIKKELDTINEETKRKIMGAELHDLAVFFNRMSTLQKENYKRQLKEFFSDFRWEDIDMYTMLRPPLLDLYEEIGERPEAVSNFVIDSSEELDSYLRKNKRFTIYGAGNICLELVKYMKVNKYSLDNIDTIAVTDIMNNPSDIEGIKVLAKNDINWAQIENVLIAVFERTHHKVYRILSQGDYEIKGIGKNLFS